MARANLNKSHEANSNKYFQITFRSEATVLLPDETDSSPARLPSEPPSAPPSYEDVIKDNPGVLSRGVPMAPPPYSESLTMTQV